MTSQIMIFHEHHGDRMFPASTVQQIRAACLKILMERLEYGFLDVGEPPIPPDVPREQVDTLPPGKTRDQLVTAWKEYEKEQRIYVADITSYQLAKLAARHRDGALAHEYFSEMAEHGDTAGYHIEVLEEGTSDGKSVVDFFKAPVKRDLPVEFHEYWKSRPKEINEYWHRELIGTVAGVPVWRAVYVRKDKPKRPTGYNRLFIVKDASGKKIVVSSRLTEPKRGEPYELPKHWEAAKAFDPFQD